MHGVSPIAAPGCRDLSQDLEVTRSFSSPGLGASAMPGRGAVSGGPGSFLRQEPPKVKCVCSATAFPPVSSPSRHSRLPSDLIDGSSERCGLSTRLCPPSPGCQSPQSALSQVGSVWESRPTRGECGWSGAGHVPPFPPRPVAPWLLGPGPCPEALHQCLAAHAGWVRWAHCSSPGPGHGAGWVSPMRSPHCASAGFSFLWDMVCAPCHARSLRWRPALLAAPSRAAPRSSWTRACGHPPPCPSTWAFAQTLSLLSDTSLLWARPAMSLC